MWAYAVHMDFICKVVQINSSNVLNCTIENKQLVRQAYLRPWYQLRN